MSGELKRGVGQIGRMGAIVLGLLWCCGAASAATVAGRATDSGLNALTGTIRFVPLSTPQALGTNTVWDVPSAVPVTNGTFSVSLVGGLYRTETGPWGRSVRILVPPDDTNVYQFNYVASLATNLGTFVWTNPPGVVTNLTALTNAAGNAALFFSGAGAFWWFFDLIGRTNSDVAMGMLTADRVSVAGGGVQLNPATNPDGVTASGDVRANALKSGKLIQVLGPATNQWMLLTNGSLVIPPFSFPNEAVGADGLSGGIFFADAGTTLGNPFPQQAHYILNLVSRSPSGLGELLISHQDIALEPQVNGQIILGNDGTSGGIVRIRADSAFGQSLQVNVAGHSQPLVFEAATKDSGNAQHWVYPSIMAFHALDMTDGYAGDPASRDGSHSLGELAFFTATPWPTAPNGALTGGVEMGRMLTNGWRLWGKVTLTNLDAGGLTTNYAVPGGATFFITNGLIMKVQ